MTTAAHLRKTVLSLPGATEEMSVFTVAGERFAALSGGGRVELDLPAGEAGEVAATYPTAERLAHGVRLPLADINGQQLNHWVRRAWLAHAPERLAAAALAAQTAAPGRVGVLPKSIGRPATQALVSEGITTLAQVAELSDAELAAIHGVGPKAIRLLRAAIAT